MTSDPIEPLGDDTVFEGKTFSVSVERFRHADGDVVVREVVRRQDAAAAVVFDDEHVWLVRQPREAILQFTLEIPAGKLDVEGESPLETVKRELAEEVGHDAEHWAPIASYYPSSGYCDERVHIFAATGLTPSDVEPDPGERIEIVHWPLSDLDGLIASTTDGKTLIGLQWLSAQRRRAGA